MIVLNRAEAVERSLNSLRPGATFWWLVLVLAAVLSTPRAEAHWSSDSQLSIQATNREVVIRWEIAMRDLDMVLGLDENGDGRIPEEEWRKKEEEIVIHASSHLGVRLDGRVGALEPGKLGVVEHLDGVFMVLHFVIRGAGEVSVLELDYRLFDGLDPHHRGLVQVVAGEKVQTAVLDRFEPQQTFILASPSLSRQLFDFGRKGVWHIWSGYDHLLFLLALLLPSVLERQAGIWIPALDARGAAWRVVRVITAFTVAHSITLSLAALEWIRLPGALVESMIAISVAVAAFNNLRPMVLERGWLIAFGFGLIHGFGFATVLTEFGMNKSALILALIGFNSGVEAGQLACVAVFFPVAYGLRKTPLYQFGLFRGGSAVILILALVWALERMSGSKWLPF